MPRKPVMMAVLSLSALSTSLSSSPSFVDQFFLCAVCANYVPRPVINLAFSCVCLSLSVCPSEVLRSLIRHCVDDAGGGWADGLHDEGEAVQA